MKKISREIAARLGLKRFFTGVPCRNGHIYECLVNGKECVECHRLSLQRQKARDPERFYCALGLANKSSERATRNDSDDNGGSGTPGRRQRSRRSNTAAGSGNEKTARGFSESDMFPK